MPKWLSRLLPEGWSERDAIIAAAVLTVGTFILSLVGVAIVVVRIPHNYFVGDYPPPIWVNQHRVVRWLLHALKNILGVLLVVLGVIMSLPGVPGQGILTVLIGAMLLDFPGKRKVEKWLLGRRGVLKSINKIRARAGRPPLEIDGPPKEA